MEAQLKKDMDTQDRFEQIWREYQPKLRRFINRRVSDHSFAADDILQEVFIKIHKRLDTLEDNSKLNGWVFRIARNTIIDHYRSRKLWVGLPDSLETSMPDEIDENREIIADWLYPMIETLPEPYRETLLMSEVYSMPHRIIAENVGLSVSAVKSRVQRGRKMVKEMLTDCCLFEMDHQGKVLDYRPKSDQCRTCQQSTSL